MNLKRQILTLMAILAFVSADAKIAMWSIAPKYQKLTRYYGDLYAFQENGKWGLIKPNDQIILPAKYDYITPFVNGYSLAGSNDNSNYLLEAIVDENGQVANLSEKYYLPKNYQYFSDGKLVVVNKSGKYGYLNPSGVQVIKCQFDNALPFKEGWGPVKQGNYMKFINENYDRNASRGILIVDFHYGEMTTVGCFSNGRAPIAYNKDFALIGTNGQKICKLNETEFKQIYKSNNSAPNSLSTGFSTGNEYVEFQENGRIGLKSSNEIIVTPQFDSFSEKYSDGGVLASLNGKQGLLRITDGDVSVRSKVNGVITSELEGDGKGHIQHVTFECSVPGNLKNYRILLDDGSGQLTDKTSAFNRSGNTFSLSIAPTVIKNAENCDTRIVVESDGLVLADERQHFSIVYPIQLSLALSGPKECRANKDDWATARITARISNNSNREQSVTIQWSTDKNESITVPAHGHVNSFIQVKETNIQSKYTKTYSVALSSGVKGIWNITWIPYW